MLIIERCGFCAHYEPIEGIFGNCKEKKDTTFSPNPKCKAFLYKPKREEEVVQPEWNAGHQMLADYLLKQPNSQAERFQSMPGIWALKPTNCQPQQEKPEKTEWESPLYRKKRKPRKIIDFGEEKAKREIAK